MLRNNLRSIRSFSNTRIISTWNTIPLAPPDKILGITEAYNKDTNPNKISLGVGAYRDNSGNPVVFPSVKKAEQKLLQVEKDKEYTAINGSKNFQNSLQSFIFNNEGKDPNGQKLIDQGRIVTSQSISGTGSLRLIGEFLNKFYQEKDILVPKPTWSNHLSVFKESGLNPTFYTYYDVKQNGLDFDGLIKDLSSKTNDVVLLHACCHNPTGMDLTSSQWDQVLDVVEKNKLYPVVDMAYMGFSSGKPDQDIEALRKLNKRVVDGSLPGYALCQSFAKNMGLYGERVGSINIVAESKDAALAIESQLKAIVRSIYSSPPIHGSKLVELILNDPELYSEWKQDLDVIVGRLNTVRQELYDRLDKTNFNWDHLLKQRGMFVYTGLSTEQVLKLRLDYSIYCTDDGRFSISGINDANVEYLANAINKVIA